jgi:hypothetical protein
MRFAKVALVLLAAVTLSACLVRHRGHVSGGAAVEIRSDGHNGGPPPGRGWRK